MENPPNAEGKNHERQLANLHYIGCVFTTPNGGLQEELTKQGANPKGYMNRTPGPSLPGTGLRYAPSKVGLFLCNEFGSHYNTRTNHYIS